MNDFWQRAFVPFSVEKEPQRRSDARSKAKFFDKKVSEKNNDDDARLLRLASSCFC